MLGKGFMHKYSGHELPGKTADLFNRVGVIPAIPVKSSAKAAN